MPTPKPNESQLSFVSRCVVDSESLRDFPNREQRIAFCYSQYERYNKNNIITKQNNIDRDKWQSAFEKQLDIAEKKQIAIVKRFYKKEYNKGIESFLSDNPTSFRFLFNENELKKIYINLYTQIGLRFAKWYVNNFQKYLIKQIDTSAIDDIWKQSFGAFGSAIGAQRVTLVSETARKTLIKTTQRLMSDPDFMTLGIKEKSRILKNQFNKYSQWQSERLVRTEATAAANFAQTQAAQTIFSPEQLQKEWIASFDDRTRSTHSEADTQVVMANETFIVGGMPMMFPGDPMGGAAETINCRCSVAYFPIQGAQTTGEITNINFGLSGGGQTNFGSSGISNAIATAIVSNESLGFIPARSLKEAEERFLKFAPKVNFRGLNLAQQNEILEAIEEILGKYNVTLAKDIGFQIKRRRSLGVAGRDFDNNPLYIRFQKTFARSSAKVQADTIRNFNLSKEKRIKRFNQILQEGTRSQFALDRIKSDLEKLLNAERWAMYQEGSRPLYTTALHEAFHSVDHKYGLRDIFAKELKKLNVKRNDWYKVSEYGGSKIAELFVETGTAIQTGISIPIEFVEAFNKTLETIKIL